MNFLVSDIKITYQPKLKVSQMAQINTAEKAFKAVIGNWDQGKIQFIEQFKVLLLNRNSRLLGIYEVSSGGMHGTIADPKLIFIAALKSCACSLILVHNHPSGNLKPSSQDLSLTRRLIDAGKLLDIEVIDHLIITVNGFVSFADEGWI